MKANSGVSITGVHDPMKDDPDEAIAFVEYPDGYRIELMETQLQTETKRRPSGRPFVARKNYLITFTAKCHEQVQQVDEDVVDVHVQRQGRHHVIGLTAMHNLADVKQNVCRENQHCNRRDSQ